MSLFQSLFEKRARVEGPYSLGDDGMVSIFRGAPDNASGVHVDEVSSLGHTAVYACVRILAESIASLPLILYRKQDGGDRRERATKHPLYSLLHDEPNSEMSSFVWRETMMAHLTLWGNHYSVKEFDGSGRIVGLHPVHPGLISPERARSDNPAKRGKIVYRYSDPSGKSVVLFDDEVFHVPGLSFDGIKGMSVIQANRETIGLGVAAKTFGASYFGHGSSPGGILTTEQPLEKGARKRLREDWESAHQGQRGWHKVAVLGGGFKFQPITVNPDDSQLLELLKFSVAEIGRIWRVPLILLQETEKSTSWGTGIEQQMIGFVQHTLRPWAARIEQEIRRKLLDESERDSYFAEFLFDDLLKGDLKARYDAYKVGKDGGWLSSNDIRRRENMDPIPGPEGDAYGSSQPAQPEPGNPDAEPEDDDQDDAERTLGAFRALLERDFTRLAAQEERAVTKAVEERLAKGAEGFIEWLEDYYGRHLRGVLSSDLADLASRAGSLVEIPADWAEEVAADLCARSSKAIADALARSAAQKYDSRAAILALLDAIRDTKPVRMTELAMQRLKVAAEGRESHERAA